MDVVAIDILSGLLATSENFKYILVITDYFTKCAEAYPLKDAGAPTCMRALYNMIKVKTTSPNSFTSFVNWPVYVNLKSKTTPFHPLSDGRTERMNRTLFQMLRATCQENPQEWPHKLENVMSAYRMTVHKVTGITPNLAMLGCAVMLPATLIARPPEEPVSTVIPFNQSLQDCLIEAHSRVRKATQSVAKIQKSHFDKGVEEYQFTVGQLVWLYTHKPGRLQQVFCRR